LLHLVNAHFGDIPHFHYPLYPSFRRKKICIEFSASYPLTTFRIPQTAFCKIPFPSKDHGAMGDDCRLLGDNANQWRPVNFITTI